MSRVMDILIISEGISLTDSSGATCLDYARDAESSYHRLAMMRINGIRSVEMESRICAGVCAQARQRLKTNELEEWPGQSDTLTLCVIHILRACLSLTYCFEHCVCQSIGGEARAVQLRETQRKKEKSTLLRPPVRSMTRHGQHVTLGLRRGRKDSRQMVTLKPLLHSLFLHNRTCDDTYCTPLYPKT